MPAPLVFALGTPSTTVVEDDGSADAAEKERIKASVFAAKNEVLRKIFGFDGAGMLKAVAGDRTLRGVGKLLKGSRDDTPPGLGNWDNSCYQNCVIQGLASLRSLDGFLTKGMSTFDSLTDDSTHGALLDISQKLNDPGNHGRHLWTPAKLKSMSSWQQQDAQEYFSKILDEIDKEISRAEKQSRKLAGLEDLPFSHENTQSNVQMFRKSPSTSFPETLRNPLEGLLAQRVGCMSCGFTEGLSMIPFNCLTVPLQNLWGYGCEIRDCLHEYTKLEPIEGVECAKCTLLRTKDNMERLLSNGDGSEQPEALRESLKSRLDTVRQALEDEDFADNTVIKRCQIPRKNWTSSTKSRQAVIGRPPKSLVIHVNRSVFDEMTGAMSKNYASVKFPEVLDLGPWALGSGDGEEMRGWPTNPTESMIAPPSSAPCGSSPVLPYELRSVVTHYGRHENGHYICYRKHPYEAEDHDSDRGEEEPLIRNEETERWWRLSDEDVSRVSKEDVLAQGGVFMLFYEAMEVPRAAEPDRRTSTATIKAVVPTLAAIEPYSPVEEQDEDPATADAFYEADDTVDHSTPLMEEKAFRGISRRTSTATLRAAAAPSSEVEHYEAVAEQEDEGSPIDELSHEDGMDHLPEDDNLDDSLPALAGAPSNTITPKSSFTHDPAYAIAKAQEPEMPSYNVPQPAYVHEDSSDEYNSEEYNSEPDDNAVLPLQERRHNRQRNSTISISSTSSAPSNQIPSAPLSISPSAEDEPTPYAEPPESALFSPTSTIRHSYADYGPQTPIIDFQGPRSPVYTRAIEESIEEEEDEPRWSTSRSEYAPSTIGGSISGSISGSIAGSVAGSEYAPSYAPSSAAPSEGDASDYEGYAESGVGEDESVDGEETQEAPKRFSQTMRTAGAGPGSGQGEVRSSQDGDREKMGLDGLRMVTAS
ncbi:uncharacterized protein K452DRAFT_311260 [Aplosporella prunicola CBS 121167]|uniref:ubiquitinyl hydrolase 1 n=1 Tax=Aplosporella prunicola CBS 121167 TaxID=1176127 RepID=A0A6A6B3L0_9PEZI|nr:uncharacterized protein K452DRAFT_311260 [Aplosporella prunicola CBS 121167]KAF2138789.1 hypothetical protein K452DRAFT_311260 [Aplosporella prunicola CBS 121167]